MWGWEWYQPTTLMGRPVISANLCGSQGALGTERQREELYIQGKTAEFYKFLMSQQNSRSLWRGGKTQCRELMGASSPAPSGATAAEANWILFACGNKHHLSSCSNQPPRVCVDKRLPSAAPGALLTSHLPLSLPAELPPPSTNTLQFYL